MVKPTWSTASFVRYVGGFTVLAASGAALAYLAASYGAGAFAAWTLLPLAVLYAVAHAFRLRDDWLPAGLFIVAAMVLWVVFLGALGNWWGWLPDERGSIFGGWHWGLWLLLLAAIAAAFVDLRQFRFPLLVVFPAVLVWFLVVDVLSGGGGWAAVLTLLVGLLYLAIGVGLDAGSRRPYGFWMHVASGVLIGGALLYWWRSSDADWALVAATAVVFVVVARATGRSSWAVLGIVGFLAATAHFVAEWAGVSGFPFLVGDAPGEVRGWVPAVVYGVVGFFFVLLGLWARGRQEPAA